MCPTTIRKRIVASFFEVTNNNTKGRYSTASCTLLALARERERMHNMRTQRSVVYEYFIMLVVKKFLPTTIKKIHQKLRRRYVTTWLRSWLRDYVLVPIQNDVLAHFSTTSIFWFTLSFYLPSQSPLSSSSSSTFVSIITRVLFYKIKRCRDHQCSLC